MYPILLTLHSWNRWLVLIFGLLAVVTSLRLALSRLGWTPRAERISVFFTGFADLQLLLGVALYAFATPWMRLLFNNPAGVMAERVTRFWSVEHLFGMIVALTLIHIGRVKVKKSPHEAKAKKAAIFFTIAMLVMLGTIPWPGLPQERPLFRTSGASN